MLKSTKKVIIDGRTGREEFIYLEIVAEQRDSNNVSFLIQSKIMVENVLQDLIKIPAIYKKSTFFSLFGELSLNDFEVQKYELAKAQIEYNKKDFWNLTAEELEII